MTEQPKLIESVEEWRRALDANALQVREGSTWTSIDQGIPIRDVRVLIDQIEKGLWRWKPTEYEYEYVTMESFRLGDLEKYTYNDGFEWVAVPRDFTLSQMQILATENRLRRKKVEGEIELVEAKTNDSGIPVVYLRDTDLRAPDEDFTYSRSIPVFRFEIPINESERRTVKGVIHEE